MARDTMMSWQVGDSGTRVLSLVPSHHNHAIGEHIGIRFDADHVVTFPAPGRGAAF